jgi:hypothetical protein
MTTLQQLSVSPHRETVIADAVALIDAHVKRKGLVVRAAYAALKAIKHGIVPDTIDSLLDAWLAKLEPHYATHTDTLSAYFATNADRVADDLLSVTDERAAKSSRSTVKKLYARLRDSAKENVAEALPELGAILERRLAAVPVAA